MLRGASKDVLNEVERNLADAMNVVRTIYHDPRLVPGGGASEMTLAHALIEGSKVQEPIISESYKAAGTALEIIPRTLLENCGADIIRSCGPWMIGGKTVRGIHANHAMSGKVGGHIAVK